MARNRQRPALRPEEIEVQEALTRIYDGASVSQHDDGSVDGMYDLDLRGPFDAAIEVGMITDNEIRRANAHWKKALEPHETTDLKWQWTFIFDEDSGPNEPRRYPWVARPSVSDLTAVLARLEARGIQRIGRASDWRKVERGGWRIGDPDVAALFHLLGAAAQDAQAVDLSHHGVPGGWSFALGWGGVSTADPDQFAMRVQILLHGDPLEDMRDKLDRSGLPTRIAALVFDSSTGDGWATGHLQTATPAAPIDLPTEITHVLILGMNSVSLMFSETEGWSRHEPGQETTSPATP